MLKSDSEDWDSYCKEILKYLNQLIFLFCVCTKMIHDTNIHFNVWKQFFQWNNITILSVEKNCDNVVGDILPGVNKIMIHSTIDAFWGWMKYDILILPHSSVILT